MLGHPGLRCGPDQSEDQRETEGARGSKAEPVTADELGSPVPARIRARSDGKFTEKAPDVGRESLHARVPALRLRTQRGKQDHVQIAAELAREPKVGHGGGWPSRRLRDHPLDVEWTTRREMVRALAREQFIQKDA